MDRKISFRSAYEKIEMAMQNTKIDLALKEMQWHDALLSTVKRWAHFIDTDPRGLPKLINIANWLGNKNLCFVVFY